MKLHNENKNYFHSQKKVKTIQLTSVAKNLSRGLLEFRGRGVAMSGRDFLRHLVQSRP